MEHTKEMTQDNIDSIEVKLNNKNVTIPYARQEEFMQAHGHGETAWRVQKIQSEFVKGYDFLEKFGKSVSIFGSARNGFGDEIYEDAEQLAAFFAREGFAVFTGGGPGIMEAANKGAHEANGVSVGININLPQQDDRKVERRNPYIDQAETFDFFFSRKVILSYSSQFYVFFPGGFGTMDEFFQMITLVQTKKTLPIPIILVGKKYWSPLVEFMTNTMCRDGGAINEEDLDLFHLVDDAEEAMKLVKTCLIKEDRE